MAYLPYARASQDASQSELERCCWETQNMLDKYGFNLRQSLQVSQPQWHPAIMPTVVAAHNSTNQSSTNDVPEQSKEDGEDVELEDQTPQSLIEGEYADFLYDDSFWSRN
jgi:hypothetical protein